MKAKRMNFPEIMAALFVLLFLYTAISKLQDLPKFIGTMRQSSLIANEAPMLGGLIPALELAAVILLIIPATRQYGLVAATLLMLCFTLYTIGILLFEKNLPCACGGVISRLSWKQHAWFNGVLLVGGIIATATYNNVIAIDRSSRTPVK